MICVYPSTEKAFANNGLKVMHPLKAKVYKEDNGEFYINIKDTIDNLEFYEEGMIIRTDTPWGKQCFRLTNPEIDKDKIISKGYHLYFDTKRYVIVDSYVVDKNCNDALDHLNNACDTKTPFNFISDISTINSYRCVRHTLEEAISTVLDRWGGHLVRDNFNIEIRKTIGEDRGVVLSYAKNIESIKSNENWDNVVTKILPVGKDGLLLPTTWVEETGLYDIPYTKVVSFSQDDISEDDYKTDGVLNADAYKTALLNDLEAQAKEYLNTYKVPQVNYTLSANIQNVSDIGDTIHVKHPKCKIDLITNVIAIEYDCIAEKYTKIEFGNFKNKLSDLINNVTTSIEKNVKKDNQDNYNKLKVALEDATNKINSMMSNSYVIYDGSQILIVDALPKESARNVIRINSGGIGFSQNGINGIFRSAWTIDGTLDMQNINVINLVADLIKGGTLKLGGKNNTNGSIEVYDEKGNVILKVDKNGLKYEVINNLADRTASLELKDKEIEASVDTLKENVNDISTTNKTVSNKNSLYVEEALEENALEFRVKGKSEQITYTGKNLLNYIDNLKISVNGLTSTLNEDDSITTTGIPTYDYTQPIKVDVTNLLIDGETYTFGMQNADSHLYLQMNIKATDGTSKYYTLNNGTKYSFVVDKTTYSNYTLVLQTPAKSSWGTSSRTITNKYILVKGTDTTFEPYVGGTSSPNPSYPQEINTIKGIENLIDITTVTKGIFILVATGNQQINNSWTQSDYIKVTPNTDYTLSNSIAFAGSGYFEITTYTKDKTWISSKQVGTTGNKSYTFITDSNTYYVRVGAYLLGDKTNDFQLKTGKISGPYVTKGSNWLAETILGKNILDLKSFAEVSSSYYKYDTSNNTLTLLTNDSRSWVGINSLKIPVKPNTTYYFKCEGNARLQYGLYKPNDEFIKGISINSNETFTTPDSTYYIRIKLLAMSGVTYPLTASNILLCEDKISDKNYEPYKEQSVLINLKNNELCSNKDLSVRDELVVNETETYIDKHIRKIILDGSDDEGYYYVDGNSGNGFSQFNYATKIDNIDFSDNGSKVLCTHLDYYVNAHNPNKTQSGIRLYANNPAFVFSIPDTIAKTVDELRTYLSNNPFEIYYALSTPEKIELEKVDIPLYENINNLTLLEDLETNTSVKYLTNNVTNQMYATRSQLKIAENSIRSDVNAKFKCYPTTTEMNNTIEQKITDSENAISLKVEQVDKKATGSINEIKGSLELKISKDENDEIVSMLNASAKEINLKSNRFSLESDKAKIYKDGTVEFIGGTIGGFELTKNEFKTNISVTRNYTQNDLNKVQQYLLGQATLTNEEIDYYDANGDGTINILDLLLIQKVLSGTDSATVTGTFELNSSSSLKSLKFKDSDGKTTTSVGINGIGTKCISADTISVNDIRKKDGNPFFSSGCSLLSSIGSYITTDTLISYYSEYDLYIIIGKIASTDTGRVTAVVPAIAITQSGTSINIADNSGFVSGLFTVNSSNQVLFRHRARSGTGYIEQVFGVKL